MTDGEDCIGRWRYQDGGALIEEPVEGDCKKDKCERMEQLGDREADDSEGEDVRIEGLQGDGDADSERGESEVIEELMGDVQDWGDDRRMRMESL